MSRASLKQVDADHFEVSGVLDANSVSALSKESKALWQPNKHHIVDLSAVSHTNSAGIALLVDWMIQAQKHGCELSYANMPPQMLAIARVSELETVLPFAIAD